METKELCVQIPEGFEIDKEKSTFDRIIFKRLPVRGKTWKEIMEITKPRNYIASSGYNTILTGFELSRIENSYSCHTNHEWQLNKLRALAQLFIIMDYYNQGWIPNWENEYETKYRLSYVKRIKKLRIETSYQVLHGPIVFKTRELAEEAYNNNKEIFDTFFTPNC